MITLVAMILVLKHRGISSKTEVSLYAQVALDEIDSDSDFHFKLNKSVICILSFADEIRSNTGGTRSTSLHSTTQGPMR